MIEVHCPECSATFELDDSARGAMAECGGCGVTFQIPSEGAVGVLIDEEKTFEVVCPECKTNHEVPDTVRGVEAECAVCGTLFRIPDVGIFGTRVEEEPPPKPDGSGGGALPPPEPVKPAFESKNKTRTLRISRESVMGNVMRPHLKKDEKPAGRKASRPASPSPKAAAPPKSATLPKRAAPPAKPPAKAAPPTPASGPAPAPALPKPTSAPSPSESPPPAAEPEGSSPAPAGQVQDGVPSRLPDWVAAATLEEDEEVVDHREMDRPGPVAAVILSLIPVILIPVAGALADMMLGLILGGVGLLFWGLSAFLLFTGGGKGGVILTNRRAIATSGKNVVSVTKDNES